MVKYKKPTKKEMKEYTTYLNKEAKKFKITAEDLSNLYDLFHIVDSPSELNIDLKKTLKLSNMDQWFNDFFNRMDDIILKEVK